MQVQKVLSEPSNILLVDDIITRGATLLGAASRLAEAFPKAEIRAFAVMRAFQAKMNSSRSIVQRSERSLFEQRNAIHCERRKTALLESIRLVWGGTVGGFS
jgi:phosphoribosylpyrophosphate synthetase